MPIQLGGLVGCPTTSEWLDEDATGVPSIRFRFGESRAGKGCVAPTALREIRATYHIPIVLDYGAEGTGLQEGEKSRPLHLGLQGPLMKE